MKNITNEMVQSSLLLTKEQFDDIVKKFVSPYAKTSVTRGILEVYFERDYDPDFSYHLLYKRVAEYFDVETVTGIHVEFFNRQVYVRIGYIEKQPKAKQKQVTFRAYWEVFSDITVPLPDDIPEEDADAIKAYIQEMWDGMELPDNAEYLLDSDEVDFEHGYTITTEE